MITQKRSKGMGLLSLIFGITLVLSLGSGGCRKTMTEEKEIRTKLKTIKQLHEEGLLTDEAYEKKQSELLEMLTGAKEKKEVKETKAGPKEEKAKIKETKAEVKERVEIFLGFEDESEISKFESSTIPLELSTEHVTQGKHSLKFTIAKGGGRKSRVKIYLQKTNFCDISGYEYFAFDIYNDSESSLPINIKLEDGNDKAWEMEERVIAPKYMETIKFPISTMKSKGMDPTNMYKIDIWAETCPSEVTLYLDNWRLGIPGK